MSPFVAKVLVGLGAVVALVVPACANGIDDSASSSSPSSAAGGSSGGAVKLPTQEKCGNGVDDNGNGLVDEGCYCTDAGSTQSGEFHTDCTPAQPQPSGCVIENAHEEKCSDGRDNDCDGKLDCDDSDCRQPGACNCPSSESDCTDGQDNDCDNQVDCEDSDCRKPGQCGCIASESTCGDAKDDDCDGKVDCEDSDCQGCTPGTIRYCSEPGFCALGNQTCGPDRQWGQCSETVAFGCFGEGLSQDVLNCCTAQGACCQDLSGKSAGNCAGIDDCNRSTN